MSQTLFTRIIQGQIPGTFVYRDDLCVAFMTINPITAGHVLVVPIDEVDEWTDLSSELRSQLFIVAAQIGEAQKMAFKCERIALIIAGFEVPHCHLHLIPSNSMADLNFENAVTSANRDDLEQSSSLIIDELRRMNIAGAI
jgi:histidine triad (HIT) family protein